MDITSLQIIGGLGLFLIGMSMLIEALRGLAGDRLRTILRRSTRSPLHGVAAGTLTTAIIQSSSATTVATVGFVAAGLMTFQQALGVIFGANIGTTVTGWLVVLIGFKLDLGTVLMPLVLVGVLMKQLPSARWAHIGWALAGFSMLFIGISALQDGMQAFRGVITPESFPADSFAGRLELVGLGLVITVVTQSSSAGVAGALAALSAGAITFEQAAAMVIGMNIGTTSTAILATLGGSSAARRTGAAHVLYNLLTGIVAFALLDPLGSLVTWWGATGRAFDAQIWLVGFHTAFNLLGVMLFIGFTAPFARLVIRLVPERGPNLTGRLEPNLPSMDAQAALDAAEATARDIAQYLFRVMGLQLADPDRALPRARLEAVQDASEQAREFIKAIRTAAEAGAHDRQMQLLHGLDHIDRLRHRCLQTERLQTIHRTPLLTGLAREIRTLAQEPLTQDGTAALIVRSQALRAMLRDEREAYRETVIEAATAGEISPREMTLQMDAVRWLERASHHVWRVLYHQRPPGAAVDDTTEHEEFLKAAERD